MIGTLINAAAVITGGLIGLLFKKGIKKSYESSIHRALGIGVVIIGINGIIANMFTITETGTFSSNGELLLVISLVLGTLAGEILHIDDHLNGLSQKLETKFKITGFAAGFVNAAILFCVGAMAIIGALNDGLLGDSKILIVKSTLDFVSSVIFGASLGVGVLFAAIPVLIYQGSISLLAGTLSNVLQGELLIQVCMVGYAVILCIGINFLSEVKIKTANMLPSIFIPVVYAGIVKVLEFL